MVRSRFVAHAALALAFGVLLAILSQRFPSGLIPGDAFTYLAAGERLNAGHPLYQLSPGDRPVALEPPYWTVPLLSPPTIAVLWRPLAALPGELGIYLWWGLHLASVLAAILLIAARRPLAAASGVLILAIPFAYELSVANLNGFVLLGLVLTWRATATGDERGAGVLAAALTAFKVTPAILGWWLLVGRRWGAIRRALAAGATVLAISIVGAGLDAHLEYLSIVGSAAAGGARPLSLGGIAGAVGVPAEIARVLPAAALLVGAVAVWLLRSRPDRAWYAGVLTMVLGSPTVSISWYALLFALLAPLAWPWPGRDPGRREREPALSPPARRPSPP